MWKEWEPQTNLFFCGDKSRLEVSVIWIGMAQILSTYWSKFSMNHCIDGCLLNLLMKHNYVYCYNGIKGMFWLMRIIIKFFCNKSGDTSKRHLEHLLYLVHPTHDSQPPLPHWGLLCTICMYLTLRLCIGQLSVVYQSYYPWSLTQG